MARACHSQGGKRIRWSPATIASRKHRVQHPSNPCGTVLAQWAQRPKEAFVSDEKRSRIRALTPEEIVRIQGFGEPFLAAARERGRAAQWVDRSSERRN